MEKRKNNKINELVELYKKYGITKKVNRTIYFDESNNIRKGIIGKEKDNVKELKNLFFVLGGVALENDLKFDELLKYVKAKQKPKDAKFKFFSHKKSKFEDAISQSRLRLFFEYLLEEKILIHFHVLHFLHFSIVDIFDSLIVEDDIYNKIALIDQNINLTLKSDMFEVLYKTYDELHKLLVNYEFPNISRKKSNEFINKILKMYIDNLSYFDMNDINNITKKILREIIKSKKDLNTLVFLENNEPLVVVNDIACQYITRMLDFDDKKYFDKESEIENTLKKEYGDYENILNVEFIDSLENEEIQISDVISGFVAKLYNFLSDKPFERIHEFCNSLDSNSESFKTLNAFFKIFTISQEHSKNFIKKIIPIFIDKKFEYMCHLIMNRQI
ncbi:DUF3800 domain-containing protein [Mycoplasma sp. OR1901]|uniref:DUF3800 domain-containing protein n=1 Tax=Mycoplasma sp. OR1901 TaxID=2742195 RepID=UPI001582EBB9|nr:hypothetical protein [Mycoplasma sp. OR1901]QKT05508.1 hypothetical protein HTZ87_02215 [Mycoplasma sp. OR1901]